MARLGPVVAKVVTLRRATFGRSPDLAISADRLRCQQAKFPDGARLRVRWAEVVLDNADFGRPSVLEATPALKRLIASAEKELVQDPLTATQPYRTARPRPVCLAGRHACPPEDVCGPRGYADFLDAITDPKHERHAELLEWIGGGFDPEAFDPAEVDQIFATVFDLSS